MMAKGISLWKGGIKTKDYMFQDRIAKDHIERSGTGFNVHRYIGPYTQDADGNLVATPDGGTPNELTIEDLTVLETRDRQYDTNIVDLRGCYLIQDPAFDLSQFGIMITGDVIQVEFHLNDHTERLGRKLMSGDVLEVPCLRDELPLDQNSAPIPKYYVVQDAIRPPAGYGPTWYAHTWRVKCTPIVDTQEYMDILQNPAGQADTTDDWTVSIGSTDAAAGTGLGVSNTSGAAASASGSASTLQQDLQATQLVSAAAIAAVSKRAFFIRHLYMRPANKNVKDGLIKWIMNDDCLPPNWTGDFIPSGVTFPDEPKPGDYFIRLDYDPVSLFVRVENVWRRVQDDWRSEWMPASRILDGYLRNNNITIVNPSSTGSFPEKQALSDVIPVQADILPGTKSDDIKIITP
jgi:hypothetical protein